MIESFAAEQIEAFERDGFLIVEEGLVPDRRLELLRERYVPLFDGEYETGIRPDEVNWVPGRDPEDRTPQLCNAWKSDNVVAAARDEGDRLPSGLLVRGLPRPAGDDHVLDLAGSTDPKYGHCVSSSMADS